MMMYTLDSGAILCYLFSETGTDILEGLLSDPESTLQIHAVNWVELRYIELRGRLLKHNPIESFLRMAQVAISDDMGETMLENAAHIKAFYAPISLGDSFAVAFAQSTHSTLVTTDRGEMQKIADAGECDIVFLR